MSRRNSLLALTIALVPFSGLVASAQGADTARRVALVIGVNRYDNRNLANLEYAERDAEELSRTLQESYRVQLLLGNPADASKRATKVNVEQALEDLFGSGLT